MSGISIDKNLVPGEKISFRVKMDNAGYTKVVEFDLRVPKAIPLLNKVNNITFIKEQGKPIEKTKGNYAFTKYAKGVNIDNTYYKLKILLNSAKQANQLKPGEEVNLSSSDAKLAQLNNRNFKVLSDTNKDPRYVYLRVNKNYQPTIAIGSVTGSSLQEITGMIPTTKFTIALPKNIFKNLVTEVDIVPGKPFKEGMIEDIPVFAYKRFTGNNSSEVKRKLLGSNTNISDKTPPNRNDVLIYRGKESYSEVFENNEEEKFIFYISVARYTYNGTDWEKEWLQQTKSGDAIWGRAVAKG